MHWISQRITNNTRRPEKLLAAAPNVLLQQHGMGTAKLATLKAAAEIGKRFVSTPLAKGAVLNNSQITQQFLVGRLRDQSNEVFACLFLDNHFRLIQYEELFHGSLTEAVVYPREIARRGLLHQAAKVILAHNHPSGRALPSAADKEVTELIQQALALIEIQVIDHIIIGDTENFSFADCGCLSESHFVK